MRFHTPDGTGIAYEDEGAGPPLLCLAGLTRTMRDFDALAPRLPPVRLIRMDYRGRGGSDWSGAGSYSVAQEAADALALLDALGIESAAILGTSRGGLIGMLLAATARGRLSGLCLVDIGPALERAGLARIGASVGRAPGETTHEALAAALPGRSPGFANVPDARWLAEARRHHPLRDGRPALTYDPALREAFAAGLDGPEADLWPLFDACASLPLALVRGANSDLLSTATAAEMRRRRPDMIVAEVADRGHVPFLDEPEAVAAIRAFLAEVG